MINRAIIRSKVVQVLYSYEISKGNDGVNAQWAESMLTKSLDKAYELYMSMFQLIIDITNIHERIVDEARYKPFATEADKNPDMRLVNNRVAEHLRQSGKLNHYILNNESSISWFDDEWHLRTLVAKILNSDIYAEYLNADDCFRSDCEFWTKVIKNLLIEDELFLEKLETKCIYWNDNVDVVASFAIKTMRLLDSGKDPVMDQYKKQTNKTLEYEDDIEDEDFGYDLLRRAMEMEEANNELINRHISDTWDASRIAMMDRVIMNVAISEIKSYPKIPTPISINEYVELSKYYSSPKSAPFINGVLHNVIGELKKKREIIKA